MKWQKVFNGEDKNYIGIKLKELNYTRYPHKVEIFKPEHKFSLCGFYYDTGKFHGFSIDQKSDRRINILDHISFEDIL